MPCYSPISLKKPVGDKYPYGSLVVPCGYCEGCLIERSRVWAVRLMHELQMHPVDSCHFITLTYRDEDLVWGNIGATLWPEHPQLFLKRLRQYAYKEWLKLPEKKRGEKPNIRFYLCGEYGDTFGRPHYHIILFGLKISDKKLHTINNNNKLYTSETIDKIWKHGNTLIGDVTFESCSYTARYCLKKTVHPKSFYTEKGIHPEFARMSNRPGIGYSFYEKFFSDMFPADLVITRNSKKMKPPRYYMKKLEVDNPALFAIIKNERNIASQKNPDSSNLKRLEVKRIVKLAQLKALRRDAF